jgi:hypothetical protein
MRRHICIIAALTVLAGGTAYTTARLVRQTQDAAALEDRQRLANRMLAERARLARLGIRPENPPPGPMMTPTDIEDDHYTDGHTIFLPMQEPVELYAKDGRVGIRNWVRLLHTQEDTAYMWFAQVSTLSNKAKRERGRTLHEYPLGVEFARRNETAYALLLDDSIKVPSGTWRITVGLRDAWTHQIKAATSNVVTVP